MDSIKIIKINEVNAKILCDDGIARELDSFFTFKVPGYQFMPAYRSGFWDGKIRLFNTSTRLLYGGLVEYVKKFAIDREYDLDLDPLYSPDKFFIEDAKRFIEELGPKIEPRSYQVEAFTHAVRNKRAMMLSPTASGKSFIIYLITRWFEEKTLIIVPTTSLVHQMAGDFASYGYDSDNNCHLIYSGKEKDTDSQVTITTWQSIHRLPKSWFSRYKLVIGDEAHLFKAKSLTSIMEKLDACQYRFGFTGTLDGTQTHKLVLEGLFGPIKKVTTTSELIEQRYLSDFKIKCLILKHNDTHCKLMVKKKYAEEMDYLVSSVKRNNFIKNLTLSLKGNTLLLFQYIEKHGKILHRMIEEAVGSGRSVYFVHGGVDASDRENIRRLVEMEDNAIIIASYGTFSTGINIRNLHNIIFASPSKSRVRNLQSIGRGLRKGDNKDKAVLYDIADDLSWKKNKNFSLKHFIDRMKIYNEEKFECRIYNINIS